MTECVHECVVKGTACMSSVFGPENYKKYEAEVVRYVDTSL